MDRFRIQIKKSLIAILLVSVCFGNSDLEVGGDVISVKGVLTSSLDQAYDAGSTIEVDDTNVVWNLGWTQEFSIGRDLTFGAVGEVKSKLLFSDDYIWGYPGVEADIVIELKGKGDALGESVAYFIVNLEPDLIGNKMDTTGVIYQIHQPVDALSEIAAEAYFTIQARDDSGDLIDIFKIGNKIPEVGVPENDYPISIASTGWRPLEDNTYDFGNPDFRWKDGYFAGSIKGTGSPETLSLDATTGNITVIGAITGTSFVVGTNTGNYRVAVKAGGTIGDVDPCAVLDDLTAGGTFTGTVSDDVDYKVEIDANGTPDTFKWSDDGGSTWDASGVAITESAQTLNNGITVTFDANDGHTTGDYWEFTVTVHNPMWLQDAAGDGIMWVGNNGRVGINTEAPATIFDVNGAITATSFVIGSNSLDANEWAVLDGVDANMVIDWTNASDNFSTTGTVQGVTQAEFNTLTDNSIANALHRHTELVASDGSPDPALSVDEAGRVGMGTSDPEGSLEIRTGNSIMRIRDTGAASNATTAYITFGGTTNSIFDRTGYVGDWTTEDTNIGLRAEDSDLILGDSSSASVLTLSGGNVTATGTVTADLVDISGNILELGNDATGENIYIYFNDDTNRDESIYWEDIGDRFVCSDMFSAGDLRSINDIQTQGAGDDLWLGNATQTSANFQAYATGEIRIDADDIQLKLGEGQNVGIEWDTSGSGDLLINSNNVTASDEVHFTNFDLYSFDNDLTTTGTLDAGAITGTSLTDGTTTISGGNYTGVGNITGTDVDISAGTGAYSSSGNITTVGTGIFGDGGVGLYDSGEGYHLYLVNQPDTQNADRTLGFDMNDADRQISLLGSPTLANWFDQSVKAAASPTFAGTTISTTGEINFRDTDISMGSTLADGILDMSTDGSIRMFYDNADVGDETDGQSLYFCRRAAEGDASGRFYVDQYNRTVMDNVGDWMIRKGGSSKMSVGGDWIRFYKPIFISERATAISDVATFGQIWIKNDTPNILMFTDDAGNDFTVDVTAVP